MDEALTLLLVRYGPGTALSVETDAAGREVTVYRERPALPPGVCGCADPPRVELGRGRTVAAAMRAAGLPFTPEGGAT